MFEREQLESLILEKLKINSIPLSIEKQITRFVSQQGYTYKEIARALVYFTEVLGETLEIRYGIGIVSTIMPEAKQYFYKLKKQKEEQLRNYRNNNEKAIVIKAKPKKREIKFSVRELEE